MIFQRIPLLVSSAIACFVASTALASAGHGHDEHGAAHVEFSVEGNKARVSFVSPTEDIYGLATQAKTDADKKKVEDGMTSIKNKISEMIILDAKLGCKWTPGEANPWVVEGGAAKPGQEPHGVVEAKFDVDCTAPLAGSKVKFAVKKVFKSINRIETKVTSGGKSTTTEIKRDRGVVSL
jgi:hypothetical protein